MKKISKILVEAYVTLCKLVMAMVAGVLFFLWYPDFVSWFSNKLPTIPSFLSIIPAIILVCGLSATIFLAYLAIANWRELGKTTEVETAKL